MLGPRANLGIVLSVTLSLIAIYVWAPHGLYTFHDHGHDLHLLVLALFWLLFLTHVLFDLVMWTQRARWDAAESATFLFVAMKGVLWAYLALVTRDQSGLNLSFTYMLAVLTLTTTNADVQLVRRYFLRREDDRIGIRQGDPAGTARGDRAQAKELS